MNENIPFRAINYQWETFLYSPKIKPKNTYENKFGYRVLDEDKIQFTIYSKNIEEDIYIIGDFNEWGKVNIESFKLKKEKDFSTITINIKHKEPYLYLINNKHLRDPGTIFFDDEGNSVFWDFNHTSTYKLKHEKPERLHSATKILQTDPVGLVSKWFEYKTDEKTLAESKKDLFTYITECGVLEKIKELGFNTLQLLPIQQSIDGDNWKHRYLVAYPFALQKSFGTPDSFLKLVDKCHELGISVILDLILSHCAYKDFNLFNVNGKDTGLHNWKQFLGEETSWGTKRYRYHEKNIQRFLTESGLLYLTKYFVDGFRIDNVDGILRFEKNGDGDERPGGKEFLQNFLQKCYEHDPYCLINLESHYFHGNNAKNLVSPFSFSKESLGATTYNSSRLTYFLHSAYMPKSAENISIWTLENIRKEKEWGKSNSTIADFHNHDAAAGLMEGRATGSYAYDALILNDPELKEHAIGKIKVMESLIAFGMEGRILDILQTFLLQEGTFEHDSSIHWNKLKEPLSEEVVNYKKTINKLLDSPAFWPENTINRKYINIDENNKILVIEREDTTQETKEKYYILINFAGKEITNYSFGIEEDLSLELVLNSENSLNYKSNIFTPIKSDKFEFFSKEIKIPLIKSYHVLVFRVKRGENVNV